MSENVHIPPRVPCQVKDVTSQVSGVIFLFLFIFWPRGGASQCQVSGARCHLSYFFFSFFSFFGQEVELVCKRSGVNKPYLVYFFSFHLGMLVVTAVHQGLSKYLTAKDTRISPTLTNHRRTLSSHGNQLSLQSQSTIQEYKKISVPSIK